MKINVTEIRKNPGATLKANLTEEIPSTKIPGEIIAFRGPVKAELEVMNTGRFLQIKGILEAQTELKCSRCLETFVHDAKVEFEERYCHAAEAIEDEEEADVKVFEGDWLDITEEVIETLILGMPMKPVCREGCKGFCPQCGQNLNVSTCQCKIENIDPRLEVLRNLLQNKE